MHRLLFLCFFLAGFNLFKGLSQQAYRIYFKDKANQVVDFDTIFSEKALERRQKQGIPFDETDIPVSSDYIRIIKEIADSTGFASRWFNFVKVYLSSSVQYEKIMNLDFVVSAEQSNNFPIVLARENEDNGEEKYGLLERQTARMGAEYFERNNIDGKGIRIAIFDAGFPGVDQHEAFQEIRESGRIIKTWDFTKNRENVFTGNSHGRETFACVGGKYEGKKIGLATGTDFLLAKTEVSGEPYAEEEWWLQAAEWADLNGADIINSSLGYSFQRYFTSDMDGKTSLVVKAANMAAKKGILVVCSAGNEANSSWKCIITPADGDSVLTVGGIDPDEDYHIGFSSYGPTADKRLKPNVCAYGRVKTAGSKGLVVSEGTSFSSPLVAGFAACAWQSKPSLTNMELFHEIEKSGHLYPYYDYAHGYGVPQASYFTQDTFNSVITFDTLCYENKFSVVINPASFNHTDWLGDMNLLYYHIANSDGSIRSYYVIKVIAKEALRFNKNDFSSGDILRINFRGYTKEYRF